MSMQAAKREASQIRRNLPASRKVVESPVWLRSDTNGMTLHLRMVFWWQRSLVSRFG